MFLNIPLIAYWHAVTLKRKHLINENLMRENQKRRHYEYPTTKSTQEKKSLHLALQNLHFAKKEAFVCLKTFSNDEKNYY